MLNLNSIKKIFFIGIGGIGMSALVRFFNYKKVEVFGYDKVATKLTKKLQQEGINISYNEESETIVQEIDLVVFTPAIPKENLILQFYKKNNYLVLKRSDVLEIISQNYKTIAIAGTHGKTTITSMAAHICKFANLKPTAFIGGICKNFNGNFLIDDSDLLFVEADEYDKSFLKLKPFLSLVSSVDADHFDIYEDLDDLKNNFKKFVQQTINKKNVILKDGINFGAKSKINYSLNNENTFAFAKNIKIENATYFFDLVIDGQEIKNVKLQMQGIHNIENAIAASLINYKLGVKLLAIKNAIESFEGIKRRFEFISKNDDFVFIDDYAHHPKEIEMLLKSAKQLFPNKEITIIFQPHLFSRTKDFYKEFATSLSLADEIILTEIYPAREKNTENISSKIILNEIKNDKGIVVLKKDLVNYFENKKPQVLITAGAGDINNFIVDLKNLFV